MCVCVCVCGGVCVCVFVGARVCACLCVCLTMLVQQPALWLLAATEASWATQRDREDEKGGREGRLGEKRKEKPPKKVGLGVSPAPPRGE